ncbi:hypothetical protein [Taibaiella soli]|uniref:Uncharacterized protein n=1 Tax=Taibaiella soli TaxID=1649169 RepID=A0A2W2C3E6_9BACT|nr:hypothetical protein [Taibaiella soli]PZF74633.1 hypothetical protein DN068_03385 [Taibaiella soli]
MPNRILFFSALVLTVTLTSCHKSHSNLGQTKIQVPSLEDSCLFEMGTAATHLIHVWGKPGDAVLQINKLTGTLTDTNGFMTPISRLSAQAQFSNGNVIYNYISAGSLSLNGSPVSLATNNNFNYYISYNNAVTWNDTGTNQWQVGGSNAFPAATVSMDGSFPEFTGVLPDSISPLNYTFTFNSSNTANADSAVLFLYAGRKDDSVSEPMIELFTHGQAVDATNGVADVGARTGVTYANYRMRIQNKSYRTCLLVVVLLKESQQTVNGKVFTLARQRIVYKTAYIK